MLNIIIGRANIELIIRQSLTVATQNFTLQGQSFSLYTYINTEIKRQTDRQTDRETDRQRDRQNF